MNFEEHAAKPLLAEAGIKVPASALARDPDAAAGAAQTLGPCVVKAQVPTGKRGRAGGIRLARTSDEAREHARNMFGMTIGGHRVEKVLVEAQSDIARELYAAVLNNPGSKAPMVMFSTEGGMDIEEVAVESPEKLTKRLVDIRRCFTREDAEAMVSRLELSDVAGAVADTLKKLFRAYVQNDAELLEINPLIVTSGGEVVALDYKYTMDDSAIRVSAPTRGAEHPRTTISLTGTKGGDERRPFGTGLTNRLNRPVHGAVRRRVRRFKPPISLWHLGSGAGNPTLAVSTNHRQTTLHVPDRLPIRGSIRAVSAPRQYRASSSALW